MSDITNAEMSAYDLLPVKIRDLIKDTNYNPIDDYLHLSSGQKIELLIIEIKKYKDEYDASF